MSSDTDGSDDRTKSIGGSGDNPMVRHYRLLHEIGRGGMGKVFLAHDTRLDRTVAIKTLSEELAAKPSFRTRFQIEARAAARLTHPNICSIHGIEEVEGKFYLVMEYIKGNTLKQFASRQSDLARVRNIMIQCCDGLQAAHASGIIHRDIKSSNIMIDESDRVKIMDFGLARFITSDNLTHSGTTLGTYEYMSPEQVRGDELDFRTDVFSLGVVLYELVAGRLPFKGDSLASTLYAIVNTDPEPVSNFRDNIPNELVEILSLALEKDLSKRFESSGAMMLHLQNMSATVGHEGQSLLPPERLVETKAASSVRSSIAVFPFQDFSERNEYEYFAHGVTEDITTRLSKIGGLNVASRSAAFHTKELSPDPVKTAKRLNVSTFLEGSVRHFEGKLRITTQLINVEDGFSIWSEVFDRKLDDILSLQSEVAESIVRALNLELTNDEEQTLVRRHTSNLEAYDYYLKGKYYLRQRNEKSFSTAIDLLGRACKADPNFAPALAQLAVAHALVHNYAWGSYGNHLHLALEMAQRAVDLDPRSSEAHTALGMAIRFVNMKSSIGAFEEAVRLDPSNYEAHHFLANSYSLSGLYAAAVEMEEKALLLDPFEEISDASLSRICFLTGDENRARGIISKVIRERPFTHITHSTLGWFEWHKRNWQEAADHFERALVVSPHFLYAADYLSDCCCRMERFDRALEVATLLVKPNSTSYIAYGRLGQIHFTMGNRLEAANHFKRADELLTMELSTIDHTESMYASLNRALLSALCGEVDVALAHLSRAIQLGYGSYAELKLRPDWDSVRSDHRFEGFVADLERELNQIGRTCSR